MSSDLAFQANLITLYSTPNRHYHNFEHVQHCLREAHELCENVSLDGRQRAMLEFAIWFHDAVYDPRQTDGVNETESSSLAHAYLSSFNDALYRDMACPVGLMIQATAQHMDEHDLVQAGPYFLDIDLSILGQKWETYEKYAKNIRKEYSWVDRADYVKGRVAVLENFLAAKQIYRTEYFRNKYEAIARRNIQWEIRILSSIG